MSDDKKEMGKILFFPSQKKIEVPPKIELTERVVHDIVLALASVNMASKYKGSFDPTCKESLETGNFPCSENCGCYVHMLSSMALELVFDGEASDIARSGIHTEYTLLNRLRGSLRRDEENDDS